ILVNNAGISYNIIIWGRASNIHRVFIIQKILRVFFGIKPRESLRCIFKQYKILTVIDLYILKCAMFYRKISQLFLSNSNIHNYTTRSKI
ncbi:hypothetical protein C0J52_20355, partial [Blattella germanica]